MQSARFLVSTAAVEVLLFLFSFFISIFQFFNMNTYEYACITFDIKSFSFVEHVG